MNYAFIFHVVPYMYAQGSIKHAVQISAQVCLSAHLKLDTSLNKKLKRIFFITFGSKFGRNFVIVVKHLLAWHFLLFLFLFYFLICCKFKTGLHVIINHLSLDSVRGEWFLRMIPSVCLFRNVHGINQHHKLKPKITFDRSFWVIRCLNKLEDSEVQL